MVCTQYGANYGVATTEQMDHCTVKAGLLMYIFVASSSARNPKVHRKYLRWKLVEMLVD